MGNVVNALLHQCNFCAGPLVGTSVLPVPTMRERSLARPTGGVLALAQGDSRVRRQSGQAAVGRWRWTGPVLPSLEAIPPGPSVPGKTLREAAIDQAAYDTHTQQATPLGRAWEHAVSARFSLP